MDPPDSWRTGGNQRTSQEQQRVPRNPTSGASNKESWSCNEGAMSDRPSSGSGRRLSDGVPAPFNRTRSFKCKQLVRSQAIRESQSPPRVPSPRPPGSSESGERPRTQPSVKKKSVSVDLDDRNTSECQREPSRPDAAAKFPPLPATRKQQVVKNTIDNRSAAGAISKNSSKEAESLKTEAGTCVSNASNQIGDQKVASDARNENPNGGAAASSALFNNNNVKRSNMNVETKPESGKTNDKKTAASDKINQDKVSDVGDKLNEFGSDKIGVMRNDSSAADCTCSDCPDSIKCPSLDAAETCSAPSQPSAGLQILKPEGVGSVETKPRPSREDEAEAGGRKSPAVKMEFQQVEIQVTSGDYDSAPGAVQQGRHHADKECAMRRCMEMEEYEEEDDGQKSRSRGVRRAVCPSKQDSGICCWEQCMCCGDISPDLNMSFSDAEEDVVRPRRQKYTSEHDLHYSIESCRSVDKVDRWPNRRSGSTLTVQRASSGGNPRLLRKQSSGGSIDSGQHSITSPFLSRDNSTEMMGTAFLEPMDLNRFVKDTLNKSYKDRMALLKLEHEMVALIKDPVRRELRYPQMSSYGRLLVHRCAELFCLKHGVDHTTKQIVFVSKPPPGTPCRIPTICPFQQWCIAKFPTFPTGFCESSPQAKSILKRDAHSLDEEAAALQPSRPTPRSKSFEQREEEYSRARRRIFNSTEDGIVTWDWEEGRGNETEMDRPQLLMPEGDRASRACRLLKVQSLESHESVPVVRGVVSKAHSFGGYGDRQGVKREDSTVSTNSAPPTRILSHKGELASSNWRLSPGNSSGYRTLSARSDSITPSPTPNNTVGGDQNAAPCPTNGVLWAITDMSSVPTGALIIHPQTGQPLTNSDGSPYYYDPDRPPSTLLTKSQVSLEGVRVLTNPERRRSRLEKQRATLSPDANTEKTKSPDLEESAERIDDTSPIDQPKTDVKKCESDTISIRQQRDPAQKTHTCACQECKHATSLKTKLPNVDDSASKPDQPSVQKVTTVRDTSSQCEAVADETIPEVKKLNVNADKDVGASPNMPKNAERIGDVTTSDIYADSRNVEFAKEKEDIRIYPKEANDGFNNSKVGIVSTVDENTPNIKSILKNENLRSEAIKKEDLTAAKNEESLANRKQENSKSSEPESSVVVNLEVVGGSMTPERCVREDVPYDGGAQERRQEGYVITPTYQEVHPAGYYGSVQPMGQYYDTGNSYEEPTQDLQQYQAPPMALRPHTALIQPAPMVYPHHVIPNPMHQTPYSVQTEEIQPYQVAPPPGLPPPPGLVPPHTPHIFQVQGTPTWGWPSLALYGPHHPQPPPLQDMAHKMQPHGTFIPQVPDPAMNAAIPSVQQAYFPHAQTVLVAQPPQYFPFQPHHHAAPVLQQTPAQFPVYHPYPQQGRSSVHSHEGPATPGFGQFEAQPQNITFNQFVKMQEQELIKARGVAARSPRNANSRGPSNSGSSRATPSMGYQNFSVGSDTGFGNIDQNIINAIHFGQHQMNYGVLPFTYQQNDGLLQNIQFDNKCFNVNGKLTHKDGSAGEYQRNGYVASNDSRKDATSQMEKNMDAIQRADASCHEDYGGKDERFTKTKDRRKLFRNTASAGSLSRQESFDHDNQSHDVRSPNQAYNRSFDARQNSRYNIKIIDKPSLDMKDNTFNEQKPRFVAISKELADRVAASNLSNEAKAFVPKAADASEQGAAQERDEKLAATSTDAEEKTLSNNSEPTMKTGQSATTSDRKPFWNRQNVNMKNYHNFPKNINRQGYRNTAIGSGYDKTSYRSQDRDRISVDERNFRSYNREPPPSPTVQSRTATAAWVQRNMDSPASSQHCSNASSTNASPAPVFAIPNLSKPPPGQQHGYARPGPHQEQRGQRHPRDGYPHGHQNPGVRNVNNNNDHNGGAGFAVVKGSYRRSIPSPVASCAAKEQGLGLAQQMQLGQQRFQEQMMQRSQILQSLGGASLIQTPPAQGTLLFRQIPHWLRRAPGPSIFGSPPPYVPRATRPPPPPPR